ncbi:TPA: fimbria/pilus outer membrane usher protein [Aeromonas veronii]
MKALAKTSLYLLGWLGGPYVSAEELFDPSLVGHRYDSDIVASLQAGGQPPGEYNVWIVINNKPVAEQKLTFIANEEFSDGVGLSACLKQAQYLELGIDTRNLGHKVGVDKEQCVSLSDIPFITYKFLFAKKRLELTVPDNKLIKRASSYISPSLYNDGEPVLMTSYRFSDIRSIEGEATSRQYFSISPGANLGPWRLRSQLSGNIQSNQFSSSYMHAQRDFASIESSFRVGQQGLRTTSFDAPYFYGLQIWTSDEMLTSGRGSYTPIVRGVANSKAMVTITLNDRQVYQGSVAAGPFEIRDLNVFGSGELVVSVLEANGEESRFIQPFSTGFSLLAEDAFKYNIAAGEIDTDMGLTTSRRFVTFEARYGLPFSTTLTGGIQHAPGYTAFAGGGGIDMGSWGASFFDSVYTHHSPTSLSGQMLRARYAKSLNEIGFDFNVGFTHYLNQYTTLSQTLAFNPSVKKPRPDDTCSSEICGATYQYSGYMLDAGFSQSLPRDYGRIGANFSATVGTEQDKRRYALNYSTSVGDTHNLSLSLSRTENTTTGQPETALSLGLNYIFGSGKNRLLRYEHTSLSSKSPLHRVTINGNEFDDNALSWGGRAEVASSGDLTASGVDVAYRHSLARFNASLSHAQDGNSILNSGMEGGLVAHLEGVTFTDRLSDTNILVRAENMKGLRATSDPVRRTDRAGFMLLPGMAYRYNNVSVDSSSIPDSSRLLNVKKTLVPTQGAVVLADFPSVSGIKMLVALKDEQEKSLALGGRVFLDENGPDASNTLIDDFGRVYFEGVKQEKGTLTLKEGHRKICSTEYDTSGVVVRSGIHVLTLTCR